MRTQALFRRTRSLLQRRTTFQRALFSYSHPRYPRNDLPSTHSVSRTHKRASSSATPSAGPLESDPNTTSAAPPEDPNDGGDKFSESEKPKRRKSSKAASESDKDAAPTLPSGLNILWNPIDDGPSTSSALPPPDILQEALNNLLISLHPQTQHRATYASADGPHLEPTLALYCPIEGGNYIIDETVRELARRTGSDVVVLDTVQLAAGEWGTFGKGVPLPPRLLRQYLLSTYHITSCLGSSVAPKSPSFSFGPDSLIALV